MNSTKPTYVFIPITFTTKFVLFGVFLSYFIFGTIGNALLYAVIRKLRMRERRRPRRALYRSLTMTFLSSMAICNLLNSLLSAGVVNCLQMMVHLYTSDWSCRVLRYITYYFGTVLIYNVLVLSVERYFSIFYPLKLYSASLARKLLVGIWLGGLIFSLLLTVPVKLVREALGPHHFTITCRSYPETPLEQVAVFSSFICIYVIPAVVLIYISVAMTRFFVRQRKVHAGQPPQQATDRQANAWRLKDIKMFFAIIVIFVIPYTLLTMYLITMAIGGFSFSVPVSFIIRRVTGVLALYNCINVPVVCIMNNRDFRRTLKELEKEFGEVIDKISSPWHGIS
ncbi:probable G-protein coupled receptor 19 [Nematostella vectensis]|uniref:probable G-protein coupled receptor 19 n=1 Tax=Nematostella vectensis TaxID=45351 RepID=UPI00138FB2F9|nr:probable G-protein coupled receptor 19 [Nematostella vectensis]